MRTVNIHEAETHLSRLVEQASKGETFDDFDRLAQEEIETLFGVKP